VPALPNLRDLPPQSLARLRALNPQLMDELAPPEPQEEANLHALEARMIVARDAAIASFWRLAEYQTRTLPEKPKPKDDGGALVLRYAAATVAFIYIFTKAGVLG
jgi:hypothetical protein